METNSLTIFCKRTLQIFFILFSYALVAQTTSVKGVVLDAISKKPLEGVTIYIDGTTYGTITNGKGKFSLEFEKSNNIQVIISYLGYETKIFDSSSIQIKEVLKVYLEKKREELEAVFLQNDDWSRKKKLKYFRKHFIGDLKDQKNCRILNENDIRLYYHAGDRILYASAKKPIRIRNNSLGYDILYNLVDFEIRFDAGGWFDSFYFAGTSYFSELNSKKIRGYQRKREEVYKGSILHFMRSLGTQTLVENKFELYHKGFRTFADKLFRIENNNSTVAVYPLKRRISVLFRKKKRTDLVLNVEDFFLIDGLGNFSHPDKIVFSGFMSSQKVAHMLPLDYSL